MVSQIVKRVKTSSFSGANCIITTCWTLLFTVVIWRYMLMQHLDEGGESAPHTYLFISLLFADNSSNFSSCLLLFNGTLQIVIQINSNCIDIDIFINKIKLINPISKHQQGCISGWNKHANIFNCSYFHICEWRHNILHSRCEGVGWNKSNKMLHGAIFHFCVKSPDIQPYPAPLKSFLFLHRKPTFARV